MAKKPKGTSGEAWGILNPYGDVWTTETFPSEKAARDHVKRFWENFSGGTKPDLRKFKPVRVKVHVTVIKKEPDHVASH